MARHLPDRPSVRYLQEQAKDLLKSQRRGDGRACAILRLHRRFVASSDQEILASHVSLQEVQHALALHYGFKGWGALKTRVGEVSRATPRLGVPVNVHSELMAKGNKGADRIATLATHQSTVLEQVFHETTSPDKRAKNAAAKVLKLISEKDPAKLYSRLDFFAELIDGEDNILRWIAMDIVGNLARVDTENRIGKGLLERLVDLLADEVMITAAHSVENLWKIAVNKPCYRETITAELLKVDSFERNTECRNILAGKTITSFAQYFHLIGDKKPVFVFVRRHLNSTRNATRKKAESFLAKLQRE